MQGLLQALRNVRTSVAGVGGGALVQMLGGSGLHVPQNAAQWQALIVAVLFAVLGVLAKDG